MVEVFPTICCQNIIGHSGLMSWRYQPSKLYPGGSQRRRYYGIFRGLVSPRDLLETGTVSIYTYRGFRDIFGLWHAPGRPTKYDAIIEPRLYTTRGEAPWGTNSKRMPHTSVCASIFYYTFTFIACCGESPCLPTW